MAIKTLTGAVAAAALAAATGAHAAAPVRSSAALERHESLAGSGLLPVAIFMAAILAVIIVANDDDDDVPASP